MKHIGLAIAVFTTSLSAHSDGFYNADKANFNVPEINSGVGLIDRHKEKMIGEKVYRQIQNQLPILNNIWLEDQMMAVFRQILGQTQLGQPIALVIVNDAQINAFAVPGGLFAINSGLITTAKNIDEVAGVMSHEIAHVTQRHYSRTNEAFKGQGLLALAGIIVGTAIAAQANAEVGSAVMLGTQAVMADRQLNYSRNQEREADRIGMQFMYSAGFNPQSMADFFETMGRTTARLSYLPDFWLTHPLTSERMSEARLRANQLPKVPYSNQFSDFELLKWYTAVQTNQATEQQLQALVQSNALAGRISLATYYSKRGEFKEAQQELNLAAKIQPNHHLIALIQTDLYLANNKKDMALDTILPRQKIAPENRALALKLAEVYLAQNNFIEANRLAKQFIDLNYRDTHAWQIMQQAANLDIQNPMRTVNVLRYRAEVEYWKGLEDRAIRSLLHAQRLAPENNSMSVKINQRLKTMQDERLQKI